MMNPYDETFSTWNKVAKIYQDKFMELDLYDDTYDTFCEAVKSDNATILDIGCGPGNITKYLLKKRPDFKIEGIDVASKMIELARINNPAATFHVMDCREIDKLPRKYDGIICGFCLPYLSEADRSKLICDCSKLLNEKGVLYLSFVDGDYSKSGFVTAGTGDRTYFYFHPMDSLMKDLTNNNFAVIRVFEKIYKRNAETEESHTILIARK